jgi:hypothetical protein
LFLTLLQHDVFGATAANGEQVVLKRPESAVAARRECAMLRRVQAYPQYYVHMRSTFRDMGGTPWIEMDRLPGTGLGLIKDDRALRAACSALLKVLLCCTYVLC